MACYAPLRGFWDGAGGKVLFSPSIASKRFLELPCGRCIGCRLERGRQWAVRIQHEAQMHEVSSFVTLTYAPEFLPPDGSIRKSVLQSFMKRLRKQLSFPIRFFGVGEYGDELSRPHYHVILFGVAFADQVFLRTTAAGHSLFRSPLLEKVWPYGFNTVGAVSFESARYVASYCVKKIGGGKAAEWYRRVDPLTGEVYQLEPEFALMSRRPGIGATWFQKFGQEVYPDDEVICNGRAAKPPRYYDRLLARCAVGPGATVVDKIKSDRAKRAADRFDDNSTFRLKVRETVTRSKLSLRKREI